MKKILMALFCFAALAATQTPETFFTIHGEPNDSHLFDTLVRLVNIANRHQVPLTIEFTPQWVDSIVRVSQAGRAGTKKEKSITQRRKDAKNTQRIFFALPLRLCGSA